MRNPNVEIVSQIKAKTLELLMEKEPSEIGMRDIAAKCGVTAANIYHYFKDKTAVFQAIYRDSISELNSLLLDSAKDVLPRQKLENAANVLKDWCFSHPRRAMLLFVKTESDENAPEEVFSEYYKANKTAAAFLKECVEQGVAHSDDPERDINVFVSGLWGCIESAILKRAEPRYWNDCSDLVQRFIDMWMNMIFE